MDLDRLMRRLSNECDDARSTIDQHEQRWAMRTPFDALNTSSFDQVMQAAAMLKVAGDCLELLREDKVSPGALMSELLRYTMTKSKWPHRGSSPACNLMEDNLVAAHAKVWEFFYDATSLEPKPTPPVVATHVDLPPGKGRARRAR